MGLILDLYGTNPCNHSQNLRKNKGLFFGCTLIEAVKVKLLGFFTKCHLITKYLLPEKFSHFTSLQGEIRGGGFASLFCLEKSPAF